MILTQVFGMASVIIGLYLSSEMETGSGSMIALVSAIVFGVVLIARTGFRQYVENNRVFD